MKITVSIVDDDSLLRSSLRRFISRFDECEVMSDHATGRDAVAALPEVRPRVVLMDINLPDLDGIACVRQLKPVMPDTEFIMLTVYEDADRIFTALAAGASGYLLKQAELAEIREAIRQVSEGGAPMSTHIARKVIASFRSPEEKPLPPEHIDLTSREREVLGLLAQGMLYKEIATRFGITYHTVNNHVRHIYKKLHVNSREEAVALLNDGSKGSV